MRVRVIKNLRKWFALICAILLYYIIHEGSHIIVALCYGVFEKVKILQSMVGLQSERLEKASPKDSHIARLSS